MRYALQFLDVPRRASKPRNTGITMVRDPGYGLAQVNEVLETYGQYIDYVKTKQFELWYLDADLLMAKLHTYKAADVRPFCGGTVIEAAYVRRLVPQTFEELGQLGFEAVELSDNIIELTLDDKIRLIKQARDHDLEVLFEYGKKYDELPIDVEEATAEMNCLIEAGASRIIVERSQLDSTLGPNSDFDTAERLLDLTEAVGRDRLVFEAETISHQIWLLRHLGPDVNLGPNIDPDYVVSKLEPARCGLGRDEGFTIFQKLQAQETANGEVR